MATPARHVPSLSNKAKELFADQGYGTACTGTTSSVAKVREKDKSKERTRGKQERELLHPILEQQEKFCKGHGPQARASSRIGCGGMGEAQKRN